MRADLHMHSIHSDGTFSVEKLMNYAKEKNLDVLALTDHDSMNGVLEAVMLGKKLGIRVIPGVELSTYRNGESVHVLGYFNQDIPQEMLQYSCDIIRKRRERMVKMAKNCMEIHGLNVDLERLMSIKGTITRAHLIRELELSNQEYTREEIALKFLQEDCPAFIPSSKVTTEEGIQFLRKLNAMVVIAHPVLLKKNDINEIIAYGIDGLEGIYPKNKDGDEEKFRKLCIENNLVLTAGSDFHGVIDYSHGDLAYNVLTGDDLKLFLDRLGDINEN